MKKDKKWFVDKWTKERDKTDVHYPMYRFINEVIVDVNQLDEPEVLSQDWIDKNVVHARGLGDIIEAEVIENLLVPKQEITFDQVHDKLREESILSEKSFDYYWNCINDNVEIDEPGNLIVPKQELPVIPKYVADWIEETKEKGYPLAYAINCSKGELGKWLHECDTDIETEENQELFAEAWLGGYEVEEEQKYYVINNEKYFLLAKDKAHGFVFSTGGNSRLGGPKNSSAIFELTEQEIKDYDERYWAFAKPVEEMEE